MLLVSFDTPENMFVLKETSGMKLVKAVNYFHKNALPQIFDRVLNMLLLCYNALAEKVRERK